MVGQSVRAADLRVQFNAAVLAVKRGAKRPPQPLGEVVLQAGDVLVLQAGEPPALAPVHHRPRPLGLPLCVPAAAASRAKTR